MVTISGAGYGIFSGRNTLEIDLFDDGFSDAIIETLREGPFGTRRRALIDEWEADRKKLDNDKYIALIETMGKGRFAQRLSSRIGELKPPTYIRDAIKFVADRV